MAIITAENITKAFANHVALDDVSLQVPRGSIFGLLGPNGAGKTTLIRIINQITGPDSGRILFNDEPLVREHVERIGYLPEERGLYKKMKVGEQAMYLAQLKGLSKSEAKSRLREWFERFDMNKWWDKKVEELSKGMAQKVQFVTTVLHRPSFIILDEPFSGFDPINAELIKREIKRLRDEGATILLSTHNMGSVEEICSDIALINKSKLVLSGKVNEVRHAYRENVYDLTFRGDILSFTNALWTNFELIEQESRGDVRRARIRLLDKSTVNDLLKTVIPVVEVESLGEVVPNMNDIFIKVVSEIHDKHGDNE